MVGDMVLEEVAVEEGVVDNMVVVESNITVMMTQILVM